MPRFEVRTPIEAPPEVIFGLSLDVGVHAASMAGSNERAVAGVESGQLKLGDEVTWRARHFGVWWRMTSQITGFDPPLWFVDEQVRGPFARWHHTHYFEPTDTGTLMRDVIDFDAPLGLAGRIAERVVLNRYLPQLIRQRNRHLARAARDGHRGPE